MDDELREKRNKRHAMRRSIYDYGMGLIIFSVGFILFFPELTGFTWISLDTLLRNILGGMFVLYGGWRIYRGYRKDYF